MSKPARLLVLFAIGGILAASAACSDVRLPALVGNGMVLQRDAKINLWGWAHPAEAVRIDFQGKQFKTKADRVGRWSVKLGPYPAGGPYEMTVAGENALTLRDILIGDVWLASGQSNMEMPLDAGPEWQGGIANAEREIATAHFPRIRLFSVEKTTVSTLESDVRSQGWRAVTPESVGGFSGVAYFFGRELHQRYGIPIGMIQSVWGGTVAEAWMSEASLQPFPELHAQVSSLDKAVRSKPEHERYKQKMADWYRQHAEEDRGRVEGHDVWADPAFDASGWPTVSVPRPMEACGKDLNNFGGVVWFRREVSIPPQLAGRSLTLSLGQLVQDDVTYFNGERVGETKGYVQPRNYTVPAKLVRPGVNVLAVRLVGVKSADRGCTGMYIETPMSVQVGSTTLPLTGQWSYQPGPDLSHFPVTSAEAVASRSLPNVSTALFNGMIHPLAPFKIKGVIWYQGESNASDRQRAAQYRTLFPALIRDWRNQWGDRFPFLFVQLAGYGPNKNEPAEYPWAELREAQSMALSLPHTGMATAIDVGDEKDIHPKNKQDVAHRLVLAAAKVAYGENIVHSGPTYRSMRMEGDRIRIQFSSLGSGLLIENEHGYARGFEIAGADGKFLWARAQQDGQDILVFNEAIGNPVAVRYAWRNTPDGNVFNREGLPALPFRTDEPGHPLQQAPTAENRSPPR